MARSTLSLRLLVALIATCALGGAGLLAWTSWKAWRARQELQNVRTLAAKLANDKYEPRFGQRPFRADMYEPEIRDDRWYWGNFEPGAFFSAEVSFQRDLSDARVQIFWAADGPVIGERVTPGPSDEIPGLRLPELIDK